MESIYTSPEGKRALLDVYERQLAALERAGQRFTSRRVDTRHGETHLLLAGPEDAPPVVLLHGGNGDGVMMARGFASLIERHRCVFVDIPGEPNRSCERAFDKSRADDAIGRWMEDVLDALALERVAMLGVSGGGYLTLRCCATIPERLRRVVLITPEGLSRAGAWTQLTRVVWPLLRYRLSPGRASVRRFLAALSTAGAPVPADSIDHFSLVLEHVRSVMNLGAPLTREELRGLEAPVLLLTAGRDVLFPGGAAIERAREIIPRLEEPILEPAANHVHAGFYTGAAMARIRAFLDAPGA